jgi:glycosyltransferase involved in cell wall biosynthesis
VNILFATDVFPPKSGGSGWSTFYLARALRGQGHHVEIVLPKQGGAGIQSRLYEGLTVREIGFTASNVPALRAWQRTRALEKNFARYLAERAGEFDLIHAQHMLSISAAVAAKKIGGLPVVSTVRDYWPVCLYGTLLRDDTICPICRGADITRCLAQKYGKRARFMQFAVPMVERELERRQQTLQASDAVIAVSEYVAKTVGGIVPPEKLHVVPNLIDVDETIRLAASSPVLAGIRARLGGTRYLVFIGKLNRAKGADLLPEILEQSQMGIPMVIAGDGNFSEKLAQQPQIEVLGWIPHAETLAWLSEAQALVFPSRWAEPLSRTLLEAQALGVPTIALNTGGTRDIIQGNYNGLLADDAAGMAKMVRRLVSDPALHASLSANARTVAQIKFSPNVVVSQLQELYAGVTPTLTSVVRNK